MQMYLWCNSMELDKESLGQIAYAKKTGQILGLVCKQIQKSMGSVYAFIFWIAFIVIIVVPVKSH